jgi:apolipoprotein N-acyltransferase
MGTGREREADHSLPSSAEAKNAWSYTSTHRCTFIVWCSIKKEQGQLYFYLLLLLLLLLLLFVVVVIIITTTTTTNHFRHTVDNLGRELLCN